VAVAVGPPRSLRLFLFILPLETIVPENAQRVRYLSLAKQLDFNRFRIHFMKQGHVALRPLDSAILNKKQSIPSPVALRRKPETIFGLIPYILEPGGSSKEYRKNWARLIQKIYEVDPLTCPKCQWKNSPASLSDFQIFWYLLCFKEFSILL